MSWGDSSKKTQFLNLLPTKSISEDSALSDRCKFNFHYMDSNQGLKIESLTNDQLLKLFTKLKNYSEKSLRDWSQDKMSRSSYRFTVYGDFPRKSDFKRPKHVPHDVAWARFRLEGALRLCGFVIPSHLHEKVNSGGKYHLDENTFYVVFIDPNHQFYKI